MLLGKKLKNIASPLKKAKKYHYFCSHVSRIANIKALTLSVFHRIFINGIQVFFPQNQDIMDLSTWLTQKKAGMFSEKWLVV